MSDLRKTKADLVAEVRKLREKAARLETALGQTDARMRSLVDLAPVMIWEYDADGTITLSQGRALEILGFEPGELVGANVRELYVDDSLLSTDIEEILAGKEMTTTRVVAGRLIEGRHTPVFDENGKLERVIGVGIDVTEQREGEVNLRELSDRFSLAQRIARLGSWEWDLQDGRQIWSDETYQIFGVSPETFTPDFDAFLEFVHDEDRHRIRAALNRALADADTSFDAQHRIVLGDGTVRHLRTRGELMRRRGGKARRMIGTCQDVTDQMLADAALQESEHRFALFMDHLPAAVMIKDHESKLLYANKYMREVFAPPLRRVRQATDEMPKKVVDRWLADDRRALKDGRHEREEHIPDREGRYRWMQTIKFALPRDEAPHMIGGISWDITARKSAEEELRVREAASRQLLDGISHELKTPLNSIIGFTGVILQGMAGGLNEEQRRQLGMARQSAGHMLDLIEDAIDVTRLQTGSLEVEREAIDLGETAARAADDVEAAAAAKGLELSVEIPVGLPTVLGDRRRARQVLKNLFDNAVKFTEAGAVRLVCREAGGRVEAWISDTGPGIAPELRARIFEPVQGAVSTTGTREGGAGPGRHP
ncbi:PAS domain-containing protein, partial [bacterium]|nr:PAS domain-containing protein [bacterium]